MGNKQKAGRMQHKLLNLSLHLFLIFIIILISQATHAQVVIKEKVEINPKVNQLMKPLGQHTIRIDMQWTPTTIAGAILNYDETGRYPCRNVGGTGFQTGGNLSYQIVDVVGGQYNIQFRFNIPCEYPAIVVDAQYSIYYDETFIRTGSFSLSTCYNGNTFPFYNTSYYSPLVTDYRITLNSEDMCYNIGEDVNLELAHGCTNIEIDTSSTSGEVVNLQIISGGEYASFYYQGTASDNMSVPYSEVSSVRLKQDLFYSGSESTVVVESNIGGLTKQTTIRVHPKSSYGIEVGYVDYPIKYDETKYMEIRPYGPCAHAAELPSEIRLRAEIIKGSQLGYLEDFDNGGTGDKLANIAFQSFGGNHIGFAGSGVKTDNIDTAIVRFSTTDPELNVVDVPVIITPGPLVVIVNPDTLLPGETATISIKNRLEDGTIIDFPPEQNFEISMLDGCALGNIFVGADSGNYFYDVSQPIYFKAEGNAEGGVVKLRIGLIEQIGIGISVSRNDEDFFRAGKKDKVEDKKGILALQHDKEERQSPKDFEDRIKKIINKKRSSQPPATPENIESTCYIGEYQTYTEEKVDFQVGKEIEILLGKTKYFGVKKKTATGELKIEEIKTEYGNEPQFPADADGWEWQKTDVWGSEPVSVVECDSCGKKMGVYWEKKYPKWGGYIYNKGEYLGRYFNGMANLQNGIIRIIGRYWHKDSTYIVRLKAKTNTQDSTYIKIIIIRPTELVSEKEAATIYGSYSKTKDVFDAIVNIDSLCNYYGGILGVSPHLLKGQMHKECAKTNFGGEVKWGFAPSYRYEPYTTQNSEQVLKTLVSNPFFINATTNVNPPNHQNLKPMNYFSGDTITVWQIIEEYSQLVDKNHPDLYGKRKSNNTMDFDSPGYELTDLQEKYNSYLAETEDAIKFDPVLNKYRKLTFTERADSANKRMMIYLRDEFVFKDANKTKGMKNMIAQTRIASSYGLFQVMYTTAIGDKWKYPQSQNYAPELLNEIDTNLVYATNRIAGYISSYENKNNWNDGYEETIRKVIFNKWNGGDYSKLVIRRSQLFIPKR